jgi:F-type H+/Na+-transporting ATPase subunit alpha
MMKTFVESLEQNKEFGIIEKMTSDLILVAGLPSVSVNEVVVFETNDLGLVTALDEDFVEVLLLSKTRLVPGSRCARTGDILKIPVGPELLGNVIDPLGRSLNNVEIKFEEERDYDVLPKSIQLRAKISDQLETGVVIIDSMVPLGRGQRELIVGDRKTGKTSAILSMIKKQIELGSIVIYCSIAKEKAEVKKLLDFFTDQKIIDRLVLVAANANDPASLVDLAPYSAMTMAEYFLDKGNDVLLILDDLTSHAKFYREISLLGKRFPGRDSYPGDIFYKHARLLERGGAYKYDDKIRTITCLPLAETFDSRLTDYIVSNLISITDGHMLFDVDSFNRGLRPALNLFLSVTRVGKQTQSNVARSLNRKLFRILSNHASVESYKHFGTELSPDLKKVLEKGNKIYKFFEQPTSITISKEAQVIFLTMIWAGFFDSFEEGEVTELRKSFLGNYNSNEQLRKLCQDLLVLAHFDIYFEKFKQNESYFKSVCRT